MDNQKLQEFNKELNTLLTKYNCTLKISQNIVVVPNNMEENTNVETPVVEETTVEETTEETAE